MFWRKRAFHEEIIYQFGGKAPIILSEDSQKNFEQLKELIGTFCFFTQAAVNKRKVDSLARKSLELLPNCMRASYLSGYFLKDDTEYYINDDSDTKMRKISNMIIQICFPLFEIFNQLVELGQGPNGIRVIGGDKDQVKQNFVSQTVGCATKFFNDGVYQRNRS